MVYKPKEAWSVTEISASSGTAPHPENEPDDVEISEFLHIPHPRTSLLHKLSGHLLALRMILPGGSPIPTIRGEKQPAHEVYTHTTALVLFHVCLHGRRLSYEAGSGRNPSLPAASVAPRMPPAVSRA